MSNVTKVVLNSGYNATPLDDEYYLLTARADCVNREEYYTEKMSYVNFGYTCWEGLVDSWKSDGISIKSLVYNKPFVREDWL